MKKRWLLLLGLLAFLATMLLHVPATLVYAPILGAGGKPGSNAVRLYGAHGTLSEGGFSTLEINGRPVLKNMHWALQPFWLLLLRVTADLETQGDLELRLRVSRAVFGKLHLSGVNGVANMKALLSATGQPVLPLEGQVRLMIDSARYDQGLPVQMTGGIEIEGLTWTLAREPLALGDFNAALSTDDKGILAQIASGPGPLELQGEARLMPDRAYDLHLQLKPRPAATDQLQTLVRSLGNPDTQGWYHIRRQGKL